MPNNSSCVLHNIQVLRAITAILVILHHTLPHYKAMGGELAFILAYTLYLSHLVIIELFYLSGLRGLFTHPNIFLPIIGLFLLITICIIFSIVYYQKIEQPIYYKAINSTR